jgi:hypothetical protein
MDGESVSRTKAAIRRAIHVPRETRPEPSTDEHRARRKRARPVYLDQNGYGKDRRNILTRISDLPQINAKRCAIDGGWAHGKAARRIPKTLAIHGKTLDPWDSSPTEIQDSVRGKQPQTNALASSLRLVRERP